MQHPSRIRAAGLRDRWRIPDEVAGRERRRSAGPSGGRPNPAALRDQAAGETRFLFIDSFQLKRIERGEKPAERAVFRQQHGVAKGLMTVAAGCPAALRVGLWLGGPYDAWMRWSSDAPPDTPDLMDNTLGFAIKLFGVAGRTLAADDPLGRTADLVLQNSDVFFVDDAREMCAISRDGPAFEATHLRSKEILDEMAKREASLLAATYHSGHPYAIGDLIVKFRLVPQAPDPGAPGTSANYLAEDLRSRLLSHDRAFLLQAQAFVDQSVTPVDRASVRWEERHAPFVDVARLDIPAQDVGADGQGAYGEALAFDPWRTPHENRPLGSLADARRLAYPSSAALRRSLNGQPMGEPEEPR